MVGLCIILFQRRSEHQFQGNTSCNRTRSHPCHRRVLLTAVLSGVFIYLLSRAEWTNIHFTPAGSHSAGSHNVVDRFGIGIRHPGEAATCACATICARCWNLKAAPTIPWHICSQSYSLPCFPTAAHSRRGSVLLLLGLQFAVGGGLGLLLGWLGVRLTHIYRRLGKNGSEDDGQATAMISILLFALVFLTFTLTSMLKGNGYLAVYLCGIVIGNSKIPFRKGVSKFMDGITWLAQIVMFIMLGLLVNPHEMLTVAPCRYLSALS